jgi:hypothetical protein
MAAIEQTQVAFGGERDIVLEPVTSPLKVRWRDRRFTALNSSGETVFDGAADGADPLVCTTSRGTWRIGQRASDESGKYNLVLDADGRTIARVERHLVRHTQIVLTGGEAIPVTKGRFMLFSHGSRIGNLAVARAPYLFPQRYFTMKLRDELLSRPDCEVLVVVGAYLASIAITASIQASV